MQGCLAFACLSSPVTLKQPRLCLRIAVPDRTHRGAAVPVRTVAAGGKALFQNALADGAQFVAKRCLDPLRTAAQAVDHIRGDGNPVQLAPELCGLFPECVVIVQRSDAGIAGFAVQPAAGNQVFHGIFP